MAKQDKAQPATGSSGSKPSQQGKPGKGVAEARLPKGFRDIEAAEIRTMRVMLDKIRAVYERYGFEPLETPSFEYTDALGKFLPDQDRPNEGVFSLTDEDEQWMSLRYDLTAPLARYVAQNFQTLPKPFRRYATGLVYRNEKPGPGRFRQFTQFDADTVGADSIAADAEMCMLAADTLEALGLKGQAVIKVNNRKVLDGLMEANGLTGPENASRRLIVLRAIDKIDRLGVDGTAQLLGTGRKDDSGDFTYGAQLPERAINNIINFTGIGLPGSSSQGISNLVTLSNFRAKVKGSSIGEEGVTELEELNKLIEAAGYGDKADGTLGIVRIDPSCVRGLEYYTGPVFEAELTLTVNDENGQPIRFGSVGGGGRYDGLVERFTGQKVPATGFSIGVSRLAAALAALGTHADTTPGPVVVLVMDRENLADYQKLTQMLRNAGIRAEMYLGSSGMKAQMKYADKRSSPVAVIQGSDERARGEVTLKDLVEGAKAAAAIKDNKEWKESRPAQVTVKEADVVAEVRKILDRHA